MSEPRKLKGKKFSLDMKMTSQTARIGLSVLKGERMSQEAQTSRHLRGLEDNLSNSNQCNNYKVSLKDNNNNHRSPT